MEAFASPPRGQDGPLLSPVSASEGGPGLFLVCKGSPFPCSSRRASLSASAHHCVFSFRCRRPPPFKAAAFGQTYRAGRHTRRRSLHAVDVEVQRVRDIAQIDCDRSVGLLEPVQRLRAARFESAPLVRRWALERVEGIDQDRAQQQPATAQLRAPGAPGNTVSPTLAK
jgi:hypothetical protein